VTARVLPDAATDPAGYLLAVADLREKHIAAEADPGHALAEVALWRAVATAEQCFGKEFRLVAAAAVAAAQAYQTGADG
jgi:hypothetical protein